MQPEKKQLELLLMHYFRERSPDFPKGKLMLSESPDFILKLKTKNRVGIELTRLNPLNARLPDSNEEEQKRIRERIIESAKKIFSESTPYKLFAKFLFSDNIPLNEKSELAITARVTNTIRQAVQFRKPADFFYFNIDSETLPVGIESILIVNHPELEVPIWERSNNLGISDDVVGDIREAIHKKDEKLRIYQKQSLNFYWLVIVADRLRGLRNYNLHDKIMNHNFHSRFQQVYLFDLIKSKVFQLV
jgi:hypothetical protein